MTTKIPAVFIFSGFLDCQKQSAVTGFLLITQSWNMFAFDSWFHDQTFPELTIASTNCGHLQLRFEFGRYVARYFQRLSLSRYGATIADVFVGSKRVLINLRSTIETSR